VGGVTPFAPGLAGLVEELRWRGMFHAASAGLEGRLASGDPISAYIGFDPSASSLHIGSLVPVFGLIHLQRRGGRPVVVVGGGTGLIGDPSGRSSERNLLDDETLEHNVAGIRSQLGRFLDFGPGPTGALMVNNADWLRPLGLIEFLRDTGKHFTIPYMLAKDSVQTRLDRGLSFTEFSYMLLQSYDFAHLHRTLGVELQMGGADQWGNITAGLELIRRTTTPAGDREPAFALAYPLLLTPSGAKFGKSEAGESVWLDPDRTSPFAFYQHWLNSDDRDVGVYLRWFTLLDPDEIVALEAAHAEHPERREAQRVLARDVTSRVHGDDAAARAVADSEALFGSGALDDPDLLARLHASVGGFQVGRADLAGDLASFLVVAGAAASKGEARRLVAGGGVSVNGARLGDAAGAIPPPIAGTWWEVRVGRRRRLIGRLGD
jgi:tyrosyl-tRNA synthetase